ncbi:hypothetical protein EDC44_106109 [Cricetibacter osteomyelitidis]|uniref:Calcineurin-like phosphoesterase domain-containing protein n=1 Tax=Cricetibacter osteomyelitidis TaxID=1521931 RepID=A0A4R2TMC2_9PAST|nr:metallophosphoesterase [Cricetibacter osteomyelitidis]TCP96042.1 hypothetical protein EDC44_106109 [Cricetibacter osteomyelitidis]
MGTHYYVIFGAAFVALQLFIYIFTRTMYWIFSGKLSHRGRRVLALLIFIIPNALMVLHFTQVITIYREMAWMLVFLLYSSFVTIAMAACFRLLRSVISHNALNLGLKVFYPIGLIFLFALSLYNAYTPRVIHYSITIDKPLKPLRIAMASDFHLGVLFGSKQLDKLANIIQQEKPDLVLLPGDIMDDNTNAYVAENMQPHLAKLKAPLGVYATLGNHDFFGHQNAIRREIEKAGIKVLWDESAVINNEFVLVGRNDDLVRNRPSTAELLKPLNTKLPIFVLDHRPSEIVENSQQPIDIQVSGHAHKGQIFPANLITKMLYRLDYGYEKINGSHFFVTSGFGFWGIPLRLGSQSEVFIIDVKGN